MCSWETPDANFCKHDKLLCTLRKTTLPMYAQRVNVVELVIIDQSVKGCAGSSMVFSSTNHQQEEAWLVKACLLNIPSFCQQRMTPTGFKNNI